MSSRSLVRTLGACALSLCVLSGAARAQGDVVLSEQKFSDTTGLFYGTLVDGDNLGNSCASIGDHDGDGVDDLIVGAWYDNDGGPRRGAVWIVFMNADGTVKAEQPISDTLGSFYGVLDDLDAFGVSVASLGDVDGDGIGDVAVGAWQDDDGYG